MGIKRTVEALEKCRVAMKLKWKNPEFRKRQIESYRQSWTPRRRELASLRMIGHKHSEATIQKIIDSNIRTWHKNKEEKNNRVV